MLEYKETKKGIKYGDWEYQSYLWTDLNQTCPVATAFNKDENGTKLFYEMKTGKYNQPIFIQEPDLAFELPKNIGDGKQKIAGIITDDGQRFSLSNFMQKNNLTPDELKNLWNKDEMSFVINLKKYFLQFLYEPDKNRIVNYVGYFSKKPIQCSDVKVYEMADVLEKFAYCR